MTDLFFITLADTDYIPDILSSIGLDPNSYPLAPAFQDDYPGNVGRK